MSKFLRSFENLNEKSGAIKLAIAAAACALAACTTPDTKSTTSSTGSTPDAAVGPIEAATNTVSDKCNFLIEGEGKNVIWNENLDRGDGSRKVIFMVPTKSELSLPIDSFIKKFFQIKEIEEMFKDVDISRLGLVQIKGSEQKDNVDNCPGQQYSKWRLSLDGFEIENFELTMHETPKGNDKQLSVTKIGGNLATLNEQTIVEKAIITPKHAVLNVVKKSPNANALDPKLVLKLVKGNKLIPEYQINVEVNGNVRFVYVNALNGDVRGKM